MALINLYKNNGTQTGTLEVVDSLFGVTGNKAVVHEALVAQQTNTRTRLAQAKDRSDVRGGGRKPWKQKGTGRARHGSSRSPIWKGGGVTFGPNALQVFALKINKKAKKKALALVLSDRVASQKFVALEDLALEEAKAKQVASLRKALPGAGHSMLIVTTAADRSFVLAARNVAKTRTIGAASLNVRDLLSCEYIAASKAAIEKMTETYRR